ncbi:hypothetical protein ACOMHN_051361 [Nucella lapillus]
MDVKRREKKDDIRGSDIPPDPPGQPVTNEDGRCTCCPYGYHIDLDFLNFCQNITNGSALSNLKRIQRTKRKLRKSMEFMLEQQNRQEGSSSLSAPTPPPDVVNSTEASRLIHMVNYEQSATNQVLRDIDSGVNATLASIDNMQRSKPPSRRYTSSESEESFAYSPVSPMSSTSTFSAHQSQFDGFPAQPPVPPPRRSSLRYAHPSESEEAVPGRKDSVSSVSSVSTVSSEQVTSGGSHWNGAHSTHMTAESLSEDMALHFPHKDLGSQESPSSPMSPHTVISKASLAAIREAMAVSLHRMRDYEDQIKAIPILQVRISVLKEEKRLLALQLKAKSGNVCTRSVGVGVGEEAGDSPPSSFSRSFNFFTNTAHTTTTSVEVPLKSSTVRIPPATLPKPSRRKVDVGVGERSVVEPYLLQPGLPTGYTVTDNKVENEIRKTSEERKTIAGADDSNQADHTLPAQNHVSDHPAQQTAPRPASRSIGVGDGNVNTQKPLHIHNTEVRTVIIGANNAAVGKRNVGVEVKVPSRSVGVMFSSEPTAPPSTRTIGVNVTNDSFLDSRGEPGLNAALKKALQREVRTVGTICNFQPDVVDACVQHGSASLGSEGEQVDAASLQKRAPHRCVGTMVQVDTRSKSVCTEEDWVKEEKLRTESCDRSINTEICLQDRLWTDREKERGDGGAEREKGCDQATSTDICGQDDASTNTEPLSTTQSASQTEVGMFEKMAAIVSTGSNTVTTPVTNASTNAPTLTTAEKGIHITPTDLLLTQDKATSPDCASQNKVLCDKGANTSSRESVLCMSKVECVEILGEDVQSPKTSPKRPLTMQEHILKKGADQAFAFLGSTSSSGSLSPTSTCPKRLQAGVQGAEDSSENGHSASAGTDDCFTSVDAETSLTKRNTADLKARSVVGESIPEEEDSLEKNEQSESLTLLETSVRRRNGLADSKQSPSKVSRHRNSDGARLSQELDSVRPGIFSGRRVGSVEDFMPDEMRRLMNLNTVESESKSQPLDADSSSSTVKTVSKTTHTVTTKHTWQESGSTLTNTALEQDSDEEKEVSPSKSKSFGKLSGCQLDLSQIAEDVKTEDNADELSSPSECSLSEGIKDSGYDDSPMVHNGTESNSLQGLDFASMGSLERKELKSIMKTSTTKSDLPTPKKGISFAESVVGGTGSSSEEGGTESDEDSTTSYEEGSYDSREGGITYRCEDDEAIAQGLPGAQMYDQNIRETYELSEEMSKSCQVLADYLVDSTTIQTKELNANLAVVQEEWFRVSSHKLSSVHQVEDYLSSINEISHRLLEYIVNLVDSNGNAAIHYCVSHCNFDIVGLLLDTKVCDVRKPNKAGYTPAMLASLAFIQNDDHRDIIRQLFMAGDINAQAEKTGQTALMLATSQCRGDMVELLLETGAHCNLQDYCDDVCQAALMLATSQCQGDMVELLLETGAHCNLQDYCDVWCGWSLCYTMCVVMYCVTQTGQTALMLATSQCRGDMVELLLETGAHCNLQGYCDVWCGWSLCYTMCVVMYCVTQTGQTALMLVTSQCRGDMVELLLETGAHCNLQDYCDVWCGWSLCYTMCVVMYCVTQTGQTALMLATSQCRGDMVELLLETGAHCNLQDYDGSTALMVACEHGHTPIVQLLLAQSSCDATLMDNDQSTALSIAMAAGHKDIGVIIYKYLNFAPSGVLKKRKGSGSPTPSYELHVFHNEALKRSKGFEDATKTLLVQTPDPLDATEGDRCSDVDYGPADVADLSPITPTVPLTAASSSLEDRESSPETEV